jgi:hypothetical protein
MCNQQVTWQELGVTGWSSLPLSLSPFFSLSVHWGSNPGPRASKYLIPYLQSLINHAVRPPWRLLEPCRHQGLQLTLCSAVPQPRLAYLTLFTYVTAE